MSTWMLYCLRTELPIDGLDISPFEIIYGRGPNLPIDNILFRENYDGPMQTLEQYDDARNAAEYVRSSQPRT